MTIMARKTYFFEDLELGMEASYTRTVTEADIGAFAEVSGDKNPVHLDADYAAKIDVQGAHRPRHALGRLYLAVFGMEMPGPGAIYISQTLNFKAPVKIGDKVVAKVKVVQLFPEKRRALFECVCLVGDKPVVTGEAMLLVPARPA